MAPADKTHELAMLTADAVNRVVREWYFDMDAEPFKENIAPQVERLLAQNQTFAEFVEDVAHTAAKVEMKDTVLAIGRGCMAAFLMGWVARERHDHEAPLSAALTSLVKSCEAIRDVDPTQTEPWEMSKMIEAIDASLTELAVAETGDMSTTEVIDQDALLASESTQNAESTTDATTDAQNEGNGSVDHDSRPN